MKVSELIKQLELYHPDTDVCRFNAGDRDGPPYFPRVKSLEGMAFYQWDNDDLLLADPISKFDLKNNEETAKLKGVLLVIK